MLSATKTFLNMLFLLFTGGGFGAVFYTDSLPAEVALALPVGLVAGYALLVSVILANCEDRTLADHHIDAIYFLGFLYTLVSLVALFYELQTELPPLAPSGQGATVSQEGAPGQNALLAGAVPISSALRYVGISVSTSLAGVLFRNMSRGSYLKHHGDESDELERTYELLAKTAQRFTAESSKTFERLDAFLAERAETTKALDEAEKRYLDSLQSFVEATQAFTRGLESAQADLAGRVSELGGTVDTYVVGLERLSALSGEVAEATGRLTAGAAELPLGRTAEELERFHDGVKELNLVLDSLVSILDAKVEKVR